ncbi:AraC family transcriptional regulator [Carboxylicivirga sp. M1479]|uniref:helix-turn-helix domain-containing protein n=1 Tax=Carboxylicivirga sp. M1479 TaxID=2594476 RepID=UPI0011773D62|nr:helix-turn-helix domain-containing protein [Carboxylicivirga sp. M1479]TRX71455.1 helix-turn-helix domain-containing protein [Carboxylicivirga sp. M1479]
MKDIFRIDTISEIHEHLGLEAPSHPLVSIYRHDTIRPNKDLAGRQIAIDLYQVMFKMCDTGSFSYGRNNYDYHEGTFIFMAPGQVITMDDDVKWDENPRSGGWSLNFHPDLIRRSHLGQHIDDYSFFSYEVNEALHVSELEKQTIGELKNKIIQEYCMNIDKHSQKLIVSNIELMLDYCTRFYDRQFYTRENLNKDLVSKFDSVLKDYYATDKALETGLPTVKYCGAALNLSSNYLSDLLKKETGRNAQEHIHHFIVDRAKTKLLNSTESVSQIAYDLGFEYSQHFSKVFKKKTGISPAEYRAVN